MKFYEKTQMKMKEMTQRILILRKLKCVNKFKERESDLAEERGGEGRGGDLREGVGGLRAKRCCFHQAFPMTAKRRCFLKHPPLLTCFG